VLEFILRFSLVLLDFCWCFILFSDFFMLKNDVDIAKERGEVKPN
jgi:hypothetical protein